MYFDFFRKQAIALGLAGLLLLGLVGCIASAESSADLSSIPTATSAPVENEPVVDKTDANWLSYTSDRYAYTINYPPHWQMMQDVSNGQLQLAHMTGPWGPPNELFVSEDGCVIYFGFGGSHGPTRELINESVELNGRSFIQRTWSQDGVPIFRAYLNDSDARPQFELLHAWFAPEATETCMEETDLILSQFQFTESSTEG